MLEVTLKRNQNKILMEKYETEKRKLEKKAFTLRAAIKLKKL